MFENIHRLYFRRFSGTFFGQTDDKSHEFLFYSGDTERQTLAAIVKTSKNDVTYIDSDENLAWNTPFEFQVYEIINICSQTYNYKTRVLAVKS